MRKDILCCLPTELVLDICVFLAPVDLKCFSISNRRMHELHQRYHRRFPTFTLTGDAKLSFLLRLERDIPKYVACYKCNILHLFDGSAIFGLSGIVEHKTSTLPCDYKGYCPSHASLSTSTLATHSRFDHSKSRLSHLQLKLAMKGYYYGSRYGISTKSLSYKQIRRYPYATSDGYCDPANPSPEYMTTLFSIKARICHKPLGLYIRTQDILAYNTWEDLKSQSKINYAGVYLICQHHMDFQKEFDFEKLIRVTINGGIMSVRNVERFPTLKSLKNPEDPFFSGTLGLL